jgi:hypothetical protein
MLPSFGPRTQWRKSTPMIRGLRCFYLAFTAPHSPYQAPAEYLDKYRNIEDPTRRAYAAMTTCMDDEIGKLVSALEKRRCAKIR